MVLRGVWSTQRCNQSSQDNATLSLLSTIEYMSANLTDSAITPSRLYPGAVEKYRPLNTIITTVVEHFVCNAIGVLPTVPVSRAIALSITPPGKLARGRFATLSYNPAH